MKKFPVYSGIGKSENLLVRVCKKGNLDKATLIKIRKIYNMSRALNRGYKNCDQYIAIWMWEFTQKTHPMGMIPLFESIDVHQFFYREAEWDTPLERIIMKLASHIMLTKVKCYSSEVSSEV